MFIYFYFGLRFYLSILLMIDLVCRLVDTQRESTAFGRFNKADDDTETAVVPDEPPQADEGESSGDECDGEGDTTSAKSKQRHNQEQEYEDPEEEEIIPEESGIYFVYYFRLVAVIKVVDIHW